MGLNLNDDLYPQIREHVGHKLVAVVYGSEDDPVNVAIECETCYVVLLDANRDPEEGV